MKLTFDTYNPGEQASQILVLAPSLGGDARHQWTAVAERLRHEARIILVDLPGHAGSPVWDDGDEPTLDVVAAAVMDVVREVSESNDGMPVFFAGLSISGATGLHIARDFADEIAGVAVLCSAATVGQPDTWLARAEAVEERGTQHLVDGTRKRWFTPDFQARQPRTVDTLLEGLSGTDDHSYAQLCRALAVHDLRADLADIRTPLLLLAGERDSSTPIGDVELVASKVPGAELRTIPETAHQITVADPEDVAGALSSFMARVSRPKRPNLQD